MGCCDRTRREGRISPVSMSRNSGSGYEWVADGWLTVTAQLFVRRSRYVGCVFVSSICWDGKQDGEREVVSHVESGLLVRIFRSAVESGDR
jgi:hypothetical protein